ncbi:MAG: OmpA family protein, partial [Nitrospirae bacterium]|nr:OmpA family protein [Nitrospirota bacterium]
QAAADRETLAAQLTALSDELEHSKQRISSLTGELATLSDEAAGIRQERDELTARVRSQQETMGATERTLAILTEEQDQLQAKLKQQAAQFEAEEAEKARLEREQAAKEAEIARLTQTHAELTKSLESEIAKGDIQIQQVRDRLRINMVDRVLFDSGRAQVKPDGLKVLKRVSDILKHVTDKQIRIEGHTDNVPIGPKIIERFPTNWELSTARATSVVRYLIEKGGMNRASLSAVGYAENRPVASNETLEGRAENRRIEIVLYPKDLSDIAKF